jgi:cation diffusion facilitator family transporter
MLVSIFAPMMLSWFLKKNASVQSLILFSEGEHFSSDAFLNASVLIGVISSLLFHTSIVDSFVGLIASAIILWRALLLLRISGSVLLDEKLPEDIESNIINVLKTHEGIEGWHDLRTRRSGSEFQADVHLEFHPDILLKDAHNVADELEKKLLKMYPTLHLLTHFDIAGTDLPSCALPFSGGECQN